LPERKSEFPKTLLDEQQLQAKKIEMIKKSADSSNSNTGNIGAASANIDRNVSTAEVCTFVLFAIFLIVCVTLQMRIDSSFSTNRSLNAWINNSTYFNNIENYISLQDVKYPGDFYNWLHFFAVDKMYETESTIGMPIPEYRRKAVTDGNLLISPIRVTQRKIKFKPNFANTGMSTTGGSEKPIDDTLVDSPDENWTAYVDGLIGGEYHKPIQVGGKTYKWTKRASFENLGGYVENIDVYAQNKQETLNQVKALKDGGFIDFQTRMVIVDMIFYNPYSEIYTIVIIRLDFMTNGLVQVGQIEYLNVHARYYNFSKTSNLLRLFCELIYCVILFLYILIEVKQISKLVVRNFDLHKKTEEIQQQKEEKKTKQKDIEKDEKVADLLGYDDADEVKDQVYIPGQENKNGAKEQAEQKMQDVANQGKKVFCTYVIGLIKFVPMGLKDHFQDIWNFFDVIIFSLAAITVPLWLRIIHLHASVFTEKVAMYRISDSGGHADQEFDTDFNYAEDILNVSQNPDLYKIGHTLTTYMDIQGVLICFVIMKALNYIEKFNKKISLVFNVVSAVQQDLINFAIIFFVIFEAYVTSVRMLFGTKFDHFDNKSYAYIELWKFMFRDHNYMYQVGEESPLVGNTLMLSFLFIMQFVLFNMVRAIIANAYFIVSSESKVELTPDEMLKEKHLINRIYEQKDPVLNYIVKWVDENKADENKQFKGKNDKKAKAAQFLSDHVISRLQPPPEKKDTQSKERARWDLIYKTFKERQKKEKDILSSKTTKQQLLNRIRQQKRDLLLNQNTRSSGKQLWNILQ
jgi:hypothetical protein